MGMRPPLPPILSSSRNANPINRKCVKVNNKNSFIFIDKNKSNQICREVTSKRASKIVWNIRGTPIWIRTSLRSQCKGKKTRIENWGTFGPEKTHAFSRRGGKAKVKCVGEQLAHMQKIMVWPKKDVWIAKRFASRHRESEREKIETRKCPLPASSCGGVGVIVTEYLNMSERHKGNINFWHSLTI
jgi:hypothetical protein